VKHISGLLERELLQWPDVRVHPMFGLRAFYRGTVVFALLPDKRAMGTPRSVAYKLPGGAPIREGQKWRLFELEGAPDIDQALAHLDEAYRKAAPPRK